MRFITNDDLTVSLKVVRFGQPFGVNCQYRGIQGRGQLNKLNPIVKHLLTFCIMFFL